nr:hypothetical protein [uncultured Chitinophaga sp.]
MKPTIFKLLLFVLVVTGYAGCKKYPGTDVSIDNSGQHFIQEARNYFNHEVAGTGSIPGQSDHYSIQSLSKTALWDKAYTQSSRIGKVVVVPVMFNDNVYLRKGTDKRTNLPVNNLSRLVIFRDKEKKLQAQLLISIPDSAYLGGASKYFSGLVLSADWSLKNISSYKYDNNTVKRIIPKNESIPGNGTQSRLITVCNTLQWDIYVNGEYSYTYTQNLGCHTMYEEDGGSTYPEPGHGPVLPPPGAPDDNGGSPVPPKPEGFAPEDAGRLSCHTFAFISTASNWQESGVSGLQLVGDWFGLYAGFSVKAYGNVFVGIPKKLSGGKVITSGAAATAAAKAANNAADVQRAKYFGMTKQQFDLITPTAMAAEFRNLMQGFLSDEIGGGCTVSRMASNDKVPLQKAKWNNGFGNREPCE